MSDAYEEIVLGESILRYPPAARHEAVCRRLHERVSASLAGLTTSRLLPARTVVQISPGTLLRPDLVLVTRATGKPWLVAEVVDSEDHHPDTVTKKTSYEDARLPRLWMVDARFNNVEVYHATAYGLALQHILGGREMLEEKLLPDLHLGIADLFGS